jgi:truncated hemoglobin YjbI
MTATPTTLSDERERMSKREYQLWVIASEVRQWIKENPDSDYISVFGRTKQMFEAWLECFDNAASEITRQARAEGMREAFDILDNEVDWSYAETDLRKARARVLEPILARADAIEKGEG